MGVKLDQAGTEENLTGEQPQEDRGREASRSFSAEGEVAKGCIKPSENLSNSSSLRHVSLPLYNTILIIWFKLNDWKYT